MTCSAFIKLTAKNVKYACNISRLQYIYQEKSTLTFCYINVKGSYDVVEFKNTEDSNNAYNYILKHFPRPIDFTKYK